MDSANQLPLFLVYALTGYLVGGVYGILSLFGNRPRWFVFIKDVLFFLVLLFADVWLSIRFSLPDFRLFGVLGNVVGILLYLKSGQRTVAFFKKMCYNIGTKVKKRHAKRKKVEKTQE